MAEERLGASFTIDVTDLKAGLKTANNLIRESQSEFKAAAAGLDNWSKSETGLNAKIKSLNQITAVQREKVKALKDQYETLKKSVDKNGKAFDETSDQAIYLRTQIKNEEAALKSAEKELKNNQNALKNLGKESDTAGNKLASLGKVATAAAATIGTAFAAAGAAVVKLTKSAIGNYGEYEQLVGGVSKLFGTSGQSLEEYAKTVGKTTDEVKNDYDKLAAAEKTVAENAANAYKTAGMSANEYMETVTSFSASLIAGLGGDTQKAAEIADIAIRDMSDNVNTFGTDMSSVMYTYQGFAKQNYTMLDNLKLGYGGTQAEMARLINDSGVLGDAMEVTADTVKDVPFDKLILAINETQKRMGITGTTAKEAAGTIQGSVSMMKSSWQNLVTGLADENANLSLLIENFVDSVTTMIGNILPKVATVMNGIVKLVQELLPQIPPLIQEMLPELVKGITALTDGIVKILPDIVEAIMEVIPMLITALIEMLPTMQKALVSIIVQIINALSKMLPTIVDAIMEVLPLLVNALTEAIPELLAAAIKFLSAIVDSIPTIIDNLLAELPTIITNIVDFLSNKDNWDKIINGAVDLLGNIFKAIPTIVNLIPSKLPELVTALADGLINLAGSIVNAGITLLGKLFEGLSDPVEIAKWCWNLVESIVSGILNAFKSLAESLWNGIKSIWDSIFSGGGDNPVQERLIDPYVNPDDYIVPYSQKDKQAQYQSAIEKKIAEQGIDRFTKSPEDAINAIREAQKALAEEGIVPVFDPYNAEFKPNASAGFAPVIVNQTNNYSQTHSRYEIYKSKQEAAAAVRLVMTGVT